MKKILAILAILVCVISLASCGGPKTAISAATFKEKAEQAGFTVIDVTDQFTQGDIESAHVAMADGYQIEFYIVPTEQQAITAYEQNKANIESMKDSSSSYTDVNLSNYNKYTQTSAGRYGAVSRIDNTFIYVNADESYKSEISDFLKEIGY